MGQGNEAIPRQPETTAADDFLVSREVLLSRGMPIRFLIEHNFTPTYEERANGFIAGRKTKALCYHIMRSVLGAVVLFLFYYYGSTHTHNSVKCENDHTFPFFVTIFVFLCFYFLIGITIIPTTSKHIDLLVEKGKIRVKSENVDLETTGIHSCLLVSAENFGDLGEGFSELYLQLDSAYIPLLFECNRLKKFSQKLARKLSVELETINLPNDSRLPPAY